jgi:hypothetical protein
VIEKEWQSGDVPLGQQQSQLGPRAKRAPGEAEPDVTAPAVVARTPPPTFSFFTLATMPAYEIQTGFPELKNDLLLRAAKGACDRRPADGQRRACLR